MAGVFRYQVPPDTTTGYVARRLPYPRRVGFHPYGAYFGPTLSQVPGDRLTNARLFRGIPVTKPDIRLFPKIPVKELITHFCSSY